MADENQAGLAAVTAADTEATTPETTQGGLATGKAATAKGAFALPIGGGLTGVDPALLENMQKLIAEREAQKNSFMEGLKDATAWWSGGMGGPGEALRAREKQREEQEATTFGMKSQLAQYKSQQALAQAAQADVYKALGMGGGTPGQPGKPSIGGMFAANIDPTVAAQIADMAKTDPVGAKAKLLAHTQEMAKISATAKANPLSYGRNIEVKTPKGYETVSLVDIMADPSLYFPTEKGSAQIKAIVGTDLPGKGTAKTKTEGIASLGGKTAAQWAEENGIKVSSGGGDRSYEEQKAMYDAWVAGGKKGPVVAAPGTSKHEIGNGIDVPKDQRTAENIAKLTKAGFRNTVSSEPWHFELAGTPVTMAKAETKLALPDQIDNFPVKAGEEKTAVSSYTPPATTLGASAPAATTAPVPAGPAAAPVTQAAAPTLALASFDQKLNALNKPFAPPVAAPAVTTPPVAAPAVTAPAVTAPAAATTVPVAPTETPTIAAPVEDLSKLTMPQLRTRQKEQEEFAVKSAGERATQMEKVVRPAFEASIEPGKLAEDAVNFDRMKRLVSTDPAIAGVIAKPGYKYAIATFIDKGITTPKGTLNFKGLEDAIFNSSGFATNLTITKRQELASILARMELNAAQLIEGQGAISEGERTTLKSVSLSISNTPETIYKRAEMLERRNQLDKDIARIYGDGSNVPDVKKFKFQIGNTPEFKQYEKDIRAIANKDYDFSKPGGRPKLDHPENIKDIINKVNQAK
jgi:hypothetical protein